MPSRRSSGRRPAGAHRWPLILGALGLRELRLPLLRRACRSGIGEPEVVAVDGDESRRAPEVRRRFGPGARCPLAARVERPQPLARAERRPSRGRPAGAGTRPGEGRSADRRADEQPSSTRRSREEIGDARVSPEVPFVLSIDGTLIRGSIDLLVERPDGSVLVVDYKTDRLEGRDPGGDRQALLDPARPLRARRRSPRRAVETVYVFLERPTRRPRELRRGRARRCTDRRGGLAREPRSGPFEVTGRPHKRLCRTARRGSASAATSPATHCGKTPTAGRAAVARSPSPPTPAGPPTSSPLLDG